LQQDGLRPQQSERQSEDGVGHEQQQAQQQGQQLPSLATHSAPAHNHGQHQMGSAGAAVASSVHGTSLAHVMSVAPQQSVPMPGPPERQVSDTRPETSESSKTEKQKGRFKITEVYDEVGSECLAQQGGRSAWHGQAVLCAMWWGCEVLEWVMLALIAWHGCMRTAIATVARVVQV
jgi:hypothetical protein